MAKSGTTFPSRRPPSVDPSGYRLMYVFVPVSMVSIVDMARRDDADVSATVAAARGGAERDDNDAGVTDAPTVRTVR